MHKFRWTGTPTLLSNAGGDNERPNHRHGGKLLQAGANFR